MSQVVQHSPIQVPDYIRRLFNPEVNRALSEGIGLPMRVVSTRGKVFRLNERGVETIVTGPDGRPSPVFDCVIIRANPTLSRLYYEGAYKEGDDNPPDCWSLDNVKPDETVKAKQNPVCATCPQNAWGSKQSENGSRAKACSEVRRLAVVPIWELDQLDDPTKAPYLLRIPPGSLQALKIFGEMIERAGLPYNAISTRIAFDVNAVFQMTFEPVDFVPEKYIEKIHRLVNSEDVGRVLALNENTLRAPGTSPAPDDVIVTPPPPRTASQPQPEPQPEPVPEQPKPAPAPTQPAPQAAKPKPAAAKPKPTLVKPVSNLSNPTNPLAGLMGGLSGATAGPQGGPNGTVIEGKAEQVQDEPGDEPGDDGMLEEQAQTQQAPAGLQGLVAAALAKKS